MKWITNRYVEILLVISHFILACYLIVDAIMIPLIPIGVFVDYWIITIAAVPMVFSLVMFWKLWRSKSILVPLLLSTCYWLLTGANYSYMLLTPGHLLNMKEIIYITPIILFMVLVSIIYMVCENIKNFKAKTGTDLFSEN